jgi:YVTN family beta-propeller protein
VRAAPDGTHLYGFQGDQRSLSVVDTTTNTVSATLPITVVDVAFSADGARAYVLDVLRNITVLDAARGTVIGTIRDLPGRPVDLAVAHDGRHLFVTHSGSSDGVLDAVSVVDAASSVVVRGLPLTITPSAAALSSDGRSLVVADDYTDKVLVLDIGSDG